MTQTPAPNAKKLRVGNMTVIATHVWETHPRAYGAARFLFIHRLCRVVSQDGQTATIRLVGLKSKPKRTVPLREVFGIFDRKYWNYSA